jgi:hypothetical protein
MAEIFDLHAVSIFATGTGESDTTTHTPFCKLWNTIQRNNQCNDYATRMKQTDVKQP